MKTNDIKKFKQILKDDERNYYKLKLIDYEEGDSNKIWKLFFIKNTCIKEMFEVTYCMY